jgi:hypothetical protein
VWFTELLQTILRLLNSDCTAHNNASSLSTPSACGTSRLPYTRAFERSQSSETLVLISVGSVGSVVNPVGSLHTDPTFLKIRF